MSQQNKAYQCFVCGSLHKNYQEFQKHVVDSHDLGREYLNCPVKHCNAPVRDLRFHFKNKHPSLKVPDGIQTRALVWYDAKTPTKRRKIPNFKTGTHISPKNHGKEMHYRSGYEHEVYVCLDFMNEVVSYDVEPFSVEYYFKGRRKQYWPDIKVLFTDGHTEIWEVKPHNQRVLDVNTAKWEACKKYCFLRGWKFEVIDEGRMRDMKRRLND